MPEFWVKLLFDDTKRRIGSGSTDFLTEDELKFIGRRADGMFIDFTRGVPGVDVEVADTLSDFVKRSESGDIPKTRQEVENFCGALDILGKSLGLPEEYRQHVRNLSKRLQDYAGSLENFPGPQPGGLDAPVIDRFDIFGKREPDPVEESIRKSAFDDFTRPDIDRLIGYVREAAKTRPFAANAPEEMKQAILNDFIATFDANRQDSSWLRELKNANFLVNFQDLGEGKDSPGGMTILQDGKLLILMNAGNYPDYSDAMKVRLLHELRHVWQRLQDSWGPKFGDGINSKTDMDVEVDAHEMQFVLERILGMKAGKIRNSFEGIDKVNARYSTKLFRKADYLFSNPYKNHPDRYKVRSNMEYNEEFNE